MQLLEDDELIAWNDVWGDDDDDDPGDEVPFDILERFIAALEDVARLIEYRDDPVGFARDVLGVHLWGKQADIARAILEPPHRVLVKSANGIGKTTLAAALACWFYLCYVPSECVVTAPRFEQIKKVTFKEIRRFLRNHADLLPKAPTVESGPDHYIHGTTASDATSFQGIHGNYLFLIFEECVGVHAEFWEAARGIMAGGKLCLWLAICNPTDSTSAAYAEEKGGQWRVISISAFDHPNIAAELRGEEAPIPSAVRLGATISNMGQWGEWVDEGHELATDIDCWAMENGRDHFPKRYWRPGPIGDARILGRYPMLAAYSIYSEAAFDLAGRLEREPTRTDILEIGCDVARYGDDETTIHGQRGGVSLFHETYHGRNTEHTAGRLKQLCRDWAPVCNCKPQDIPCRIDDDGVGGGVVDQAGGYNFVPVNAQQDPQAEDDYPDARSERHFVVADRMAKGQLSLAKLPEAQRLTLSRQALGITYRLDARGRRVAEPKAKTKERLGRSPDDLDGFTLAYYKTATGPLEVEGVKAERRRDQRVESRRSRHLFGQGGRRS